MSGRGFTEEELQGLRDVFNEIDADKNGRLDKNEFRLFLTESEMDTSFVDATFQVFSKDHVTLSFDEFLEYLKSCMQSSSDPRYLFRLIFQSLDADGSGTLDAPEILEFVKLCGHKEYTIQSITKEINKIDTDGNGSLDFEELCTAFKI